MREWSFGKGCAWILIGVLAVAGWGGTCWASGVAMVLDATGGSTIADVGGTDRPARAMALIEPGESIVTPADGSVTFVLFSDSKHYVVGGGSKVQLESDGLRTVAGDLQIVEDASGMRFTDEITLSEKALQRQTTRSLGRSGGSFVSPANFGQVASGQLEFVWSFQAPAKKIAFSLYDGLDNELLATETTESSLAYPPKEREPLKPGRNYYAEACVEGAVSSTAGSCAQTEFRVLSSKEAEDIVANKKAADKILEKYPENPAPLMKLMLLYINNRLYPQAVDTGKRLEQMIPDNPNLYRFMARAYSAMGQAEQAEQASQRSDELEQAR